MRFALFIIVITAALTHPITGLPVSIGLRYFPEVPSWLVFVLNLIVTSFLCYGLFIKIFNKPILEGQQPSFIQRNFKSIGIGLIIGSVLSSFSFIRSLDCDLTIDNGTIKTVHVEYYSRTKDLIKIQIEPQKFHEITLPTGKNTLVVNGRKKNITMGTRGQKYIYNIDGVNTYILKEFHYGLGAAPPYKKEEFFSTEFFKVNADYLFEPPAFVTSKGPSTLLVLVRENNTTQ